MFVLEREQFFTTPAAALWEFIRNPHNLNQITPDDLEFKIVSPLPETMSNGLIIEYLVTVPWFGRKQWVTEIKHIREGHSFVDEQRLGPYRFWYHYHEIRQESQGAVMLDRIHYELPWGPLGRLLHRLVVAPTLKRIFDFRRERLSALFGVPLAAGEGRPCLLF